MYKCLKNVGKGCLSWSWIVYMSMYTLFSSSVFPKCPYYLGKSIFLTVSPICFWISFFPPFYMTKGEKMSIFSWNFKLLGYFLQLIYTFNPCKSPGETMIPNYFETPYTKSGEDFLIIFTIRILWISFLRYIYLSPSRRDILSVMLHVAPLMLYDNKYHVVSLTMC